MNTPDIKQNVPAIMKLFLPILPFQELKIARYFLIPEKPKQPKNSFHSFSDKIKTVSYSPMVGRFNSIDPLAEKYPSISPYAYCANNPVKYIYPTGMDVVALNPQAIKNVLSTLSMKERRFVRFDSNGTLNANRLNKSKSKSVNMTALKELANSETTYKISTADKITYKNDNGDIIEKSMGEIYKDNTSGDFGFNTGEKGWLGVTQTPGSEADKYNSTDNSIKITINQNLSSEGQAQALSHEAYGHAFLYSQGKPYRHQPIGLYESNIELKVQIRMSIYETIRNMNNTK